MSIWQKAFGKFNHKLDTIRRLSDAIIDMKNIYGCASIAETIVALGHSRSFAKFLQDADERECAWVWRLWDEAEELAVLDEAVIRAIEHQYDHSDDDGYYSTGIRKIKTSDNVSLGINKKKGLII